MAENEETSKTASESSTPQSKAVTQDVTNALAQKAGYGLVALMVASALPLALDYIDVRAKITALEMRSDDHATRLTRVEDLNTRVNVLVAQQEALAVAVREVAGDVKEFYRENNRR